MFYDITSNYKWIKSIMCHSFINELLLLWYKWNYTLQTIRLYDNNPPWGSHQTESSVSHQAVPHHSGMDHFCITASSGGCVSSLHI